MIAFFTGMPGYLEVLVILFVALLLFGNRLPNVARSLAQGIVEFRKGLKGETDREEEKKALPPGGVQQNPGIPQANQGGMNLQPPQAPVQQPQAPNQPQAPQPPPPPQQQGPN